ncbi:MAG: hypothetical protein KAJ78_05985 [Acidobacteria bacterium]|nr:hypothetical protein [Acidobacteriota bacterium]
MRNNKRNVIIATCIGMLALGSLGGAADLLDLSLPENGGPEPSPIQPWMGMPEGSPARGLIDDFNRADGPLGADWTVQADSFQIVSQAAFGGPGGGLALATHNSATGDVVEMDISYDHSGVSQYAAAILNYGGGATNIFIKVQRQGAADSFSNAACYMGNNGSSFGLGFFTLSQPFSSAHMTVSVDGSRDVTIDFTNIDGGALPDQQYICTGAPAAEGPAIGIGGWEARSSIDNFGDTPVPVELQTFVIE